MSFIELLTKSLKIDENLIIEPFKVVWFGRNGCYFEGIKSIIDFSSTEVIFCVKNGEMILQGENLRIAKYEAGDVAILGEIKNILTEARYDK